MQQEEIHNDEERAQRRQEASTSSAVMTPDVVGYTDLSSTSRAGIHTCNKSEKISI